MGSFFADIHADKESQLLGAFCGIKDTFEIQKLREDKTYQGFLDLAKALRFQLVIVMQSEYAARQLN